MGARGCVVKRSELERELARLVREGGPDLFVALNEAFAICAAETPEDSPDEAERFAKASRCLGWVAGLGTTELEIALDAMADSSTDNERRGAMR